MSGEINTLQNQQTAEDPVVEQNPLTGFKALVEDLHGLNQAQALAHWDMQTQMPEGGAGPREQQLVTLGRMAHEVLIAPRMRESLEYLNRPETHAGLPEVDRALVREMTEQVEKATRLPTELVKAFDEAKAKGFGAWVKARKADDFEQFQPVLAEIVRLSRERARALKTPDHGDLYDPLLDEYERDMTVAQIDPLFARLKPELAILVQAIQAAGRQAETQMPGHDYPESDQLAFARVLLEAIGYDFRRGRLDRSAHPFSTELGGSLDVRITVRSRPDTPLECIATALHEGGHALYEQGVDPRYLGTPLSSGTSLGIHESQSRLWENTVGKSRPFWQHFFPRLRERFPEQLADLDSERFYRILNRVRPSLIRTEADEVTYNLHILLRYELEKDLLHDRLAVAEIPAAWNAKMQEYLGVTPDSDANGCLQDVHWSEGYFGYFPTYALGNLYAAQFFKTAQARIPGLWASIAAGNLRLLKQWLNENIHCHGKTQTPSELILSVTGEPLNPAYFIDYLWAKYGEIYGISRP